MTPHPPGPRDEDRLRRLLHRAVDDVEPAGRLDEIHHLTHADPTQSDPHRKVTAMPTSTPRRPWLYGALGAAAAVVAVVSLAVVVTRGGDDPAGPVASPTTTAASTEPSPAPTSASPSPSDSATAETAAAVYYVGDGPRGPVLFREFRAAETGDGLALLGETPRDPDYRTAWQPGDVVSAATSGSVLQVTMGSTDLAARPAGMSAEEAAAAIQSVVYTAQAAAQSRIPVQFVVDGTPMAALLGVPLEGPVRAASVFGTLSLMSITAPEEGQEVSGTLEASGVNNGFEATVAWQIKQGDRVVKRGAGQAEGWMEERLFPWAVSIPLDGLAPGSYTFVAMNDDPTGGTEGNGPDVDTRDFVITG